MHYYTSGRNNVHGNLIFRLENSNNFHENQLSCCLDKLRSHRNNADYDDRSKKKTIWEKQEKITEDVQELLNILNIR